MPQTIASAGARSADARGAPVRTDRPGTSCTAGLPDGEGEIRRLGALGGAPHLLQGLNPLGL